VKAGGWRLEGGAEGLGRMTANEWRGGARGGGGGRAGRGMPWDAVRERFWDEGGMGALHVDDESGRRGWVLVGMEHLCCLALRLALGSWHGDEPTLVDYRECPDNILGSQVFSICTCSMGYPDTDT
jgi:hypothetical protein